MLDTTVVAHRDRPFFYGKTCQRRLRRPLCAIAYTLKPPEKKRASKPVSKEPQALREYREKALAVLQSEGEDSFKKQVQRHGSHPKLLRLQRKLGIFANRDPALGKDEDQILEFDDWQDLERFLDEFGKQKPGILKFNISNTVPGKLILTIKGGGRAYE